MGTHGICLITLNYRTDKTKVLPKYLMLVIPYEVDKKKVYEKLLRTVKNIQNKSVTIVALLTGDEFPFDDSLVKVKMSSLALDLVFGMKFNI